MFRVKCPICGGLLTVDERTRKLVGHMTREEAGQSPEERFESIINNIQRTKAEQDTRLAAAKKREAERKRRIEDLFKKAQDKAKEAGDEEKPVGPVWD